MTSSRGQIAAPLPARRHRHPYSCIRRSARLEAESDHCSVRVAESKRRCQRRLPEECDSTGEMVQITGHPVHPLWKVCQ